MGLDPAGASLANVTGTANAKEQFAHPELLDPLPHPRAVAAGADGWCFVANAQFAFVQGLSNSVFYRYEPLAFLYAAMVGAKLNCLKTFLIVLAVGIFFVICFYNPVFFFLMDFIYSLI